MCAVVCAVVSCFDVCVYLMCVCCWSCLLTQEISTVGVGKNYPWVKSTLAKPETRYSKNT